MSDSQKRQLFLERLKKICIQNPDFELTTMTIYSELIRFNPTSLGYGKVKPDSLINIQSHLKNNIKGGVFFTDGYFLYFNNKTCHESNFMYGLRNSIKVYISCDINNIYNVSKELLEFVLKENIPSQFKMAKEIRNDAILIRIINKEDTIKVINFINSLKYKSTVSTNPFILRDGKTSLAWDGKSSYNMTLAYLFKNYFKSKKESKSIDTASIEDFVKFIQEELINCNDYNYFMEHYTHLERYLIYKDFSKISNIILENLNGTLTKERLFEYQKEKVTTIDNKRDINDKKDKLIYIIHKLSLFYSIEQIHTIILQYVQSENVNFFTRKENIRNIVIDNFSPDEIKEIILEIGKKSFHECINLTNNKYGERQCLYALAEFIISNKLNSFTGDKGIRSKFGFIVPNDWYSLIIENELSEKYYNEIIDRIRNLSDEEKKLVSKEIEKIMTKKVSETEDSSRINILAKQVVVLSSIIYNRVMQNMEEKKGKKAGRK